MYVRQQIHISGPVRRLAVTRHECRVDVLALEVVGELGQREGSSLRLQRRGRTLPRVACNAHKTIDIPDRSHVFVVRKAVKKQTQKRNKGESCPESLGKMVYHGVH